MGGVDRTDHHCSTYGFLKKSLKWWRKLYFWISEVSLVKFPPVQHEPTVGEPSNSVSPGVPKESD
jgi:hypothetical protein